MLLDFERNVRRLGEEIFRSIGKSQRGFWKKDFWAKRAFLTLSRYPDAKAGAFQLVDALPALQTSYAVASHLRMFLEQPLVRTYPLLGKLMNFHPGSLYGQLLATITQKMVGSIASQFIAGNSPEGVLGTLKDIRRGGLAFTVDLLGEFCLTENEAEQYKQRYLDCIKVFSRHVPTWAESAPLIEDSPGESSAIAISVKLTALYSQCSTLNFKKSVDIISRRLSAIAARAQENGVQICIDPEDETNNPVIYETFLNVFGNTFHSFPLPAIGVQAYGKKSFDLLQALKAFAEARGTPIGIRLVKGAYWDHETILALQNNSPSPLYAHKVSSDANYERCTRFLLDNIDYFYPAFASHNIRSLSHACAYAEQLGIKKNQFELQVLYGMADSIALAFRNKGYLIRKYVPVGETLPGLGYLVRRLLENTSNESFLKHAFFDHTAINELLAAPDFHVEDIEVESSSDKNSNHNDSNNLLEEMRSDSQIQNSEPSILAKNG